MRLIELPPAILSLFSDPSPPTSVPPTLFLKSIITPTPSLQIKAAPAAPRGSRTPSTTSDHAVLCTADKTYSLRQVSSSNTSFLVQPTATGGVVATSTITSFLELVPVTPNAVALLRPMLREYPPAALGGGGGSSRAELLHEIPASEKEFDAAWSEVGAFEEGGVAWVPGVVAVLRAWGEAVLTAAAAGVKLASEEGFDAAEVLGEVDEEAAPVELVRSVLARMCSQGKEKERWVLDREKAVGLAGRWVLQDWAEAGKGEMMYMAFMSTWKKSVPDGCEKLCKLSMMKVGCYYGGLGRVGANAYWRRGGIGFLRRILLCICLETEGRPLLLRRRRRWRRKRRISGMRS